MKLSQLLKRLESLQNSCDDDPVVMSGSESSPLLVNEVYVLKGRKERLFIQSGEQPSWFVDELQVAEYESER